MTAIKKKIERLKKNITPRVVSEDSSGPLKALGLKNRRVSQGVRLVVRANKDVFDLG